MGTQRVRLLRPMCSTCARGRTATRRHAPPRSAAQRSTTAPQHHSTAAPQHRRAAAAPLGFAVGSRGQDTTGLYGRTARSRAEGLGERPSTRPWLSECFTREYSCRAPRARPNSPGAVRRRPRPRRCAAAAVRSRVVTFGPSPLPRMGPSLHHRVLSRRQLRGAVTHCAQAAVAALTAGQCPAVACCSARAQAKDGRARAAEDELRALTADAERLKQVWCADGSTADAGGHARRAVCRAARAAPLLVALSRCCAKSHLVRRKNASLCDSSGRAVH